MYGSKVKLLITKGDDFLLSGGRAEILALIHETGSMAETARRMDMSYRHVWGIVRKIEERAGFKVAESSRGGGTGGRTRLSKQGMELLILYKETKNWMDRAARYGPRPSLTVDGIVVVRNKLVLIRRRNEPFKGKWALPGGFVECGERLEEAVVREVEEETGLRTKVKALLGVYSAPDRDPRHHTVSTVYVLEKRGGELRAGDDAREVGLFTVHSLPELAFDHRDIVNDYIGWKKKNR